MNQQGRPLGLVFIASPWIVVGVTFTRPLTPADPLGQVDLSDPLEFVSVER